MEIYYKNSRAAINYSHIIDANPRPAEFHLHNNFEIYFFLSGSVNYFIEKKVYSLKHGDLLIMNSHEIHKPSFGPGTYERIVVHFDPDIPQLLSSPDFNLLGCFLERPIGDQNLISLSTKQIDEIQKLLRKIEQSQNEKAGGHETLKLAYFLELLVFINRVFSKDPSMISFSENNPNIPNKLLPVLDYIDLHLDLDLSLEELESKFFINRFYLSRLFKKVTGSSLHEYIRIKRISRAKKLLSEGSNVTEACIRSGFRDYSNFLRVFKHTVGVSPGQYRKG